MFNCQLYQRSEAIDLVVDSTGVKVYGEGEWKTRVHGSGKRRTWGKLHLGVN
ncbi:MAG: transposase [Okeania sp. SIO1H4]|nr:MULTISPECIES: transposase [Okeania]NEP45470.1 transposase [Okeania sp. SIO2H7]NEP71315.1 transposase [Okeania sp. SIO2G5]NEP91991.1 transposase [Okeania sp. SIO2F5]NEQ89468.1 transposase [Okeania sp. SIO2G4]NES79881.1 transposase [Okeania sp. SIO1H4]